MKQTGTGWYIERGWMNDEWMDMSIFRLFPTQAGITKVWTEQPETIAELELVLFF